MFEAVVHESSFGDLGVVELGEEPPFVVKRIYWLDKTPSGQIRGLHAHKKLQQLLLVLRGSVTVTLDDGVASSTHVIHAGHEVLHIQPGTWRELAEFTDDALVLVLASEPYELSDYIFSYEEFLAWTRG